jgi:hypothetical protein
MLSVPATGNPLYAQIEVSENALPNLNACGRNLAEHISGAERSRAHRFLPFCEWMHGEEKKWNYYFLFLKKNCYFHGEPDDTSVYVTRRV